MCLEKKDFGNLRKLQLRELALGTGTSSFLTEIGQHACHFRKTGAKGKGKPRTIGGNPGAESREPCGYPRRIHDDVRATSPQVGAARPGAVGCGSCPVSHRRHRRPGTALPSLYRPRSRRSIGGEDTSRRRNDSNAQRDEMPSGSEGRAVRAGLHRANDPEARFELRDR